MKEKYEKPEIMTEDVSIAFAGTCCEEGTNNYPGTYVAGACNCGTGLQIDYLH